MTVFAISDLHLPAREKPMDVFGAHWENHFDRIAESWQSAVSDGDVVLLPGDLTWAMYLEEALEDIRRVSLLPGKKILLRGNHDYWWNAIGRVRRSLPENMYAVQNDFLELNDVIFAGSRGWTLPGAGNADDEKIYLRERLRLEMSLKAARTFSADKPLVAMMHYPPLYEGQTGFSDILEQYGVSHCVYGHLHAHGIASGFRGEKNGVEYHLVSCDALGFQPAVIAEF